VTTCFFFHEPLLKKQTRTFGRLHRKLVTIVILHHHHRSVEGYRYTPKTSSVRFSKVTMMPSRKRDIHFQPPLTPVVVSIPIDGDDYSRTTDAAVAGT
jgi:hypothetical protein